MKLDWKDISFDPINLYNAPALSLESGVHVKVIADSVDVDDNRIVTLECRYPLMIHAQVMTHRKFSRNAQSNRAMPVARMLEAVKKSPAHPAQWGKNRAGMSAKDILNKNEEREARAVWDIAAEAAAQYSSILSNMGLHKQVANRVTMPFQHITTIITATEWDNFFDLRLNDADPTMMELARMMRTAMALSLPRELKAGEWHLPYVREEKSLDTALKVSVARCARVSYNNHDGSKTSVEDDKRLYYRLLEDGHMSPFEHQASPMSNSDKRGLTHIGVEGGRWSGNFKNWIQYRNYIK